MTASKGKSEDATTVAKTVPAEGTKGGKDPKSTGTPAPAPGRRPGVPKEVPPFCWKVIGFSHGIPLVLFKSVEQAEAEAQLQRYRAEAYYRDLALCPIDKKIPVPKNVVLAPHAKAKPTKAASKPVKKSAKPTVIKAKIPPEMRQAAKKKTTTKKAAPPKKKKKASKKASKPKAKKKTATKKKSAKAKPKSAKAKPAKKKAASKKRRTSR